VTDSLTPSPHPESHCPVTLNSGADGVGMEASVGVSLGYAVGVGDEEGVGVFDVWFG
jgi:hypothetical protein